MAAKKKAEPKPKKIKNAGPMKLHDTKPPRPEMRNKLTGELTPAAPAPATEDERRRMVDEANGRLHHLYGFLLLTMPQRAYLLAYATAGGNIHQAARVSGYERNNHYIWLREDPAYVEAFKAAQEIANEFLEQEAYRRAVEGTKQYKFDGKGLPLLHPVTNEPYYEHKYSDTLLMFLMRGRQPDKYKTVSEVNSKGEVQHNHAHAHIPVKWDSIPLETRKEILKAIRSSKDGVVDASIPEKLMIDVRKVEEGNQSQNGEVK